MASPDRNRRARSGSQLGKATTDRDRYLPPPSPTPGNERISFLTDGSNPAPMRIRRLPSSPALRRTQSYITVQADTSGNDPQPQQTARRRSSSDSDQRLRDAIQRPGLNTIATAASGLPTVVEERSTNASDPHSPAGLAPPNTGRARAASNSARSYAEKGSRRSSQSQASKRADRSQDYEAEVVDYLDVVGEGRLWGLLYRVTRLMNERPGSLNAHDAEQCPKLPLRPLFGALAFSSADL